MLSFSQIVLGHTVDATPNTRAYIEERKVALRAREAISPAPFGSVAAAEGLERMSAPKKALDWK